MSKDDHGPIPDSIRFVTKTEFQRWYGKSLATVDRWIAKGWLPRPVRGFGGKHGWWLRDLEKHLTKCFPDNARPQPLRGRVKARIYEEADEQNESQPRPRQPRQRFDHADAGRPKQPHEYTYEEHLARHRAAFSPEAVQARREAHRNKPIREAEEKIRQARVAAAEAHPDKGGSIDASIAANAALEKARKEKAELLAKRKKEEAQQQEAMRKRMERSARTKAQWAKRQAS